MKDLSVWLDWIALRFPGRQPTLEELNPGKMHGQSSMQNCPAGLITRTGTVNNGFFLFRDQ